MVMVHGGGWRRGDKAARAMVQQKAPFFVGAGYVYVSINYRLSPDVQHPAHVRDVAAGLAWLHENVQKHGGDPDRLFLMGHSAGAHLAALVATDERYLHAAGRDLAIIKKVVLLDSAAYDIPRYVDELGAGPVMRRMYSAAFGDDQEAWRDASPRTHVAPGKGIPPFLVFHTGSRLAAETLSRELADALIEAGTSAQVMHAADKDHGSLNADIGREGDWVTQLIMQFLEKGLPVGGEGAAAQPAADTAG
jgi:acetyl esterase/lipase